MFAQLKVEYKHLKYILRKYGLMVKCPDSALSRDTAAEPKQKAYGGISRRHVVKISTVSRTPG